MQLGVQQSLPHHRHVSSICVIPLAAKRENKSSTLLVKVLKTLFWLHVLNVLLMSVRRGVTGPVFLCSVYIDHCIKMKRLTPATAREQEKISQQQKWCKTSAVQREN